MSESWQVAFRTLREQFLQASREAFGLQLALTSFPSWEVYKRWYDERIDPEMKRKALLGRDQKTADSVWGDAAGVERYQALAMAAGNALPIEFRPVTRVFPHWNETANQNPPSTTIWDEFIFVAQCQQFKITKDWPVTGCQIANLDGDPFLASALAIDRFLLRESDQSLSEYRSQLHSICPGVDLANSSQGTSLPPASYGSGFFPFDLPAIFRCAVELGAAVAEETAIDCTEEAQSCDEFHDWWNDPNDSHHVRALASASNQTETAMRRLMAVLQIREGITPKKWKEDLLDLADASPEARQALLTLGLALADLRGDSRWHQRGQELLSAGTWNLWQGMRRIDRNAVRLLIAETHRVWGWPDKSDAEPGSFTGPKATLTDPRILTSDWRTGTPETLDALQDNSRASNFLVDYIRLANNGRFPMYRLDCKPSMASLPSICPKAEPKPPVQLRPDGDMLAEIEARYRALNLIGDDQTIHWVGRQQSPETSCSCDLMTLCHIQRPPEWENLRQLRQAIIALVASVWQWADKQISPGALEPIDRIGERVAGLTRAVGMELPRFPKFPSNQAFRLRGPASVPVRILEDGIILMAREQDIQLWASEWRAIRVAVDAKLNALDSQVFPCQSSDVIELDSRDVSLEAPAGTPSPLREAFEAVARALFEASTIRHCPPTVRPAFEEVARNLSAAAQTGREKYAAAEILLRAAVERNEHCAHQEALNAVCRVNDACGHVMLDIVPFHRATAHLQAVPTIDLAGLLREMRRQLSRAVLQARPFVAEPPIDPKAPPKPKEDENEKPADGTLKDGRIWLDGNPYRLTSQLRSFLSFLMANPGVSVERVRREMGWTDDPHVHKRINDLKNKLANEMKAATRKLRVWVEESCIRWEWESPQNHRR